MKKKEKLSPSYSLTPKEHFWPSTGEFWGGWNPFKEFSTIRNTMNEMLGDLFKCGTFTTRGWHPQINMYEKNENLIIEAYLPGINKENLNIHSTPDTLTISGEFEKETHTTEENYFFKEMEHGKFSRTINLPYEIKTDMIKANFKDGKLTMALPISEPSKQRGVKINIE